MTITTKKVITPKITVILLAAGSSRRLGKSKQALMYQEKPLLVHASTQASSLNLPTYVVLGKSSAELRQYLTEQEVQVIHNEDWSNGISTSIQCGLNNIESSVDSVLFMLCDQPFIPHNHYAQLIKLASENPEKIIGTKYTEGHTGVPAIIPKCFFPELQALKGDKGAQMIIKHHSDDLINELCLEASWDIDTSEQAKWLISGPPGVGY